MGFDSFYYGGFTTILESLYVDVPTIVYKGDLAINRQPWFIYKRLGLEELVVESYFEYYTLANKLLTDESYYQSVLTKVKNIRINEFIKTLDCEKSFHREFNKLIKKHSPSK